MSTATDYSLVSDYLEARANAEKIAADLKAANAEVKAREQQVIDSFVDSGVRKVTIDGKTVSTTRSLQASIKRDDQPDVVEWCLAAGMGDMVQTEVPTSRIKAYIRELLGEEGGEENIPDELRDKVSVYESFKLSVRKA